MDVEYLKNIITDQRSALNEKFKKDRIIKRSNCEQNNPMMIIKSPASYFRS